MYCRFSSRRCCRSAIRKLMYSAACCKIAAWAFANTHTHARRLTGWPQSSRKNYPSFPGFSRAINLLFHGAGGCGFWQPTGGLTARVIPHQLQQYNRSPPHSDQISQWWTKNILFVTIFPEVAQNCVRIPFSRFPCLEKSPSIPGLWPPCLTAVFEVNPS